MLVQTLHFTIAPSVDGSALSYRSATLRSTTRESEDPNLLQ